MARRSPMNQRYKKDTNVGVTRKSAASAKPKRAASGPSSSSGSSSGSKKTSGAARSGPITLPPEVKKLQNIVFASLGAAVLLSLLYLWQGKALGALGSVLIGASYALLFGALYIDFTKVRPVTKALRAGQPLPTKPQKKSDDAEHDSGAKGKDA